MNNIKNHFIAFWDATEKWITGILATSAVFLSLYGIVTRYVFRSTPDWIEEVVVYLIIMTVYVMGSKLVKEDGHVCVDFVYLRTPAKVQRVLRILVSLLSVAFLLLITYYGIIVCMTSFQMNEHSNTQLRFPMWVILTAIPIGGFLMSVRYGFKIYELLAQTEGDSKTDKQIAGTM
jgi:C4-dicarboxylate transporter, DctQ subunit